MQQLKIPADPMATRPESDALKHGGTCDVPRDVATCPECDGRLEVCANGWIEETGEPIAAELQINCMAEDQAIRDAEDREDWQAAKDAEHRYWQSDWQRVVDAIERWAGAVDG